MATSKAWKSILKKYNISSSTTISSTSTSLWKPHSRTQKVHNKIDWTYKHSWLLMMWSSTICISFTQLYIKTNSKKTPVEKAFDTTPDISGLLQYQFYEPIYYNDAEAILPHSREQPRRFLGLATNVGGALTYKVLTVDNAILSWSIMQSA